MTDWDLLMPGAGLTSVGAIGVAVSLSGIAKTFMDGMHAVSILCMFFGLIFLTAGLFKARGQPFFTSRSCPHTKQGIFYCKLCYRWGKAIRDLQDSREKRFVCNRSISFSSFWPNSFWNRQGIHANKSCSMDHKVNNYKWNALFCIWWEKEG